MGIGAVISIAGVYDVFTLGVSRLSFALAKDGLFPRPFASVHPKFRTPYWGLAFQALAAFVGATFFDLRGLITIAVFFLGICYVTTALAALRLLARHPEQALHLPGLRGFLWLAALSGAYLSVSALLELIGLSILIMAVGAALYVIRSGAWREAGKIEEELRREGREIESRAQAWLWRTTRRLGSHLPGNGS